MANPTPHEGLTPEQPCDCRFLYGVPMRVCAYHQQVKSAHDALAARVQELEATLDANIAARDDIALALDAENQRLRAELDAFVGWIDKYAEHADGCHGGLFDDPCPCGLNQLLNRGATRPPEAPEACPSCRRKLPPGTAWHHCAADEPPYSGIDDGPERSIINEPPTGGPR